MSQQKPMPDRIDAVGKAITSTVISLAVLAFIVAAIWMFWPN
jgi:hypothetical protein